VPNSATKGIQGMQAVSNLPISTWHTTAAQHNAKLQALSLSLVLPVSGQK